MNGKFGLSLRKSMNKLAGYAIWVLIVLLAFSTAGSLSSAARVKAQIKAEADKVAKMQKDNEELQNKVLMTQNGDYIEREIRNKLGLVKEGEAIVVLPDPDVLRQIAPKIMADQDVLPDPNWRKWLGLFVDKK